MYQQDHYEQCEGYGKRRRWYVNDRVRRTGHELSDISFLINHLHHLNTISTCFLSPTLFARQICEFASESCRLKGSCASLVAASHFHCFWPIISVQQASNGIPTGTNSPAAARCGETFNNLKHDVYSPLVHYSSGSSPPIHNGEVHAI